MKLLPITAVLCSALLLQGCIGAAVSRCRSCGKLTDPLARRGNKLTMVLWATCFWCSKTKTNRSRKAIHGQLRLIRQYPVNRSKPRLCLLRILPKQVARVEGK